MWVGHSWGQHHGHTVLSSLLVTHTNTLTPSAQSAGCKGPGEVTRWSGHTLAGYVHDYHLCLPHPALKTREV